MQRLTLLAASVAALAVLGLPAAANAPSTWTAGRGVEGSFTVLATADGIGWAGGFAGALARTTDGGRTWATATPPSSAGIRDIATDDGQTIFALDARGSVFRSTDAGTTWTTLAPTGGMHPIALSAFGGDRLLLVGRRSLLYSGDAGNTFKAVTPKLAKADLFTAADEAGGSPVVSGPHSLLISNDLGLHWQHMRLPPLARGDALLDADFVVQRGGFVLTAFRQVFRTGDAGHHWTELLGTGGAGADIAFSDPQHGYLAAPGFANRFDGFVLYTNDAGASWRPQPVASRFLSKVAAQPRGPAYAIANEGTALFATRIGSETGKPITVGFRPAPRAPLRGGTVAIRGRVAPAVKNAGVAVSMRSAGRWIARYVRTDANGVFTTNFVVQRTAAFVVQVPAGGGHGSAASKPVIVEVHG
jgi:photosystem II stability/assembly factor-like uncharacterized protein